MIMGTARRPSMVIFVTLVLTQHCGPVNCAGGYSSTVSADLEYSYPSLWISDLFHRTLANFTVRNVGSPSCRTQTAMYERNLRNYTSWAVRMAESWERRPIGVLGGNKYHMGIYDECVNVHYPIRGQYCLSEFKLTPLNNKDYSFNKTEDLDDFGINHAWRTALGWVDTLDQVQRNILNLGICIPDSCSAFDLEMALQKDLDMVFSPKGVKAFVKVDPILCTVSGDMYTYDTGFYVTSAFFISLVFLCSSVTIYHFIELSRMKNKGETSLVTKVLDNRFFVPLGRLSYSVFLVNLSVMVVSQSVQRLPFVFSVKTVLDAWIYDTVKTYLMALALYMVVEAPFGNLTRILFGRGQQKKRYSITLETPVVKTITPDTSKSVN